MRILLRNYESETLLRFFAGRFSLTVYDRGRKVWKRNGKRVRDVLENTGLKRSDFTRKEHEIAVRQKCTRGGWSHRTGFVLRNRKNEQDIAWDLIGQPFTPATRRQR